MPVVIKEIAAGTIIPAETRWTGYWLDGPTAKPRDWIVNLLRVHLGLPKDKFSYNAGGPFTCAHNLLAAVWEDEETTNEFGPVTP